MRAAEEAISRRSAATTCAEGTLARKATTEASQTVLHATGCGCGGYPWVRTGQRPRTRSPRALGAVRATCAAATGTQTAGVGCAGGHRFRPGRVPRPRAAGRALAPAHPRARRTYRVRPNTTLRLNTHWARVRVRAVRSAPRERSRYIRCSQRRRAFNVWNRIFAFNLSKSRSQVASSTMRERNNNDCAGRSN